MVGEAGVKYLKVKNWELYQHYTDRNPPWIKLHNSLLDDFDFMRLDDELKWQLIAIWLLASRTNNKIAYDETWIGMKIGIHTKPKIELFISLGFLTIYQDASNAQAEGKQNAIPRALARDREETETETEKSRNTLDRLGRKNGRSILSKPALARFEKWYAEYPRKEARGSAEKAWAKYDFDDDSVEDMVCVLQKQRRRWTDPKFIPHPATYLNRRQWEDVPVKQLGEEYAGDGNDIPF